MTRGGELRQNVVTGSWVVVAPERGSRPVEEEVPAPAGTGPRRADCPFCPGNEAELPGILDERPGLPGEPWGVRVVPNRYRAFGAPPETGEDPGPTELEAGPPVTGPVSRPARGHQEVIVETPVHDREPSTMSRPELDRLLATWRDRYRAAAREARHRHVVLFRNRGRAAGASLSHPHTQLVAVNVVPPRLGLLEARAADWHARHGSCLLCDLPTLEPEAETRHVHDDGDTVAFVPWAPETALEVWIAPRAHRPELGDATDAEVRSLARTLGRVLAALRSHGGDPAYNLVLHSGPGGEDGAAHRHWFLRVRPRASRAAGFELATDVHLVPSLPEEDAARLRGEEAAAGTRRHGRSDPTPGDGP